MSRIGREPIAVPAGVTVTVDADNNVTVKGPLGELKQSFAPSITIAQDGATINVTRANDEKENRALHGLTRTLLNNMVVGVTKGYEKKLEIVGVGYRVEKQGQKLVLGLGYSHPVIFEEANGIKFECPTLTEVNVSGINKELVGQIAANIRKVRLPEPYHGYGIRYKGEVVEHKEGKTSGKGKK